MKGKQIVAIDVGSTNVVIAVGSVENDGTVTILGITSEPVEGVVAGRVENSETVGRAVRAAKERIENMLGIKITEAYAGLYGDFIRCAQVTDHVYVQDDQNNGCYQITERDLESLNRRMQSVKLPNDSEEIIMKEPLRFKADNKDVLEPVGAYGKILYGTYNFILADRTMRDRLYHCLLQQEITVKSFVPNALVAHLGVATTDDIEDGAVIINLGGGTTDVTVLLNGKVQYIASIPMGMHAINADIRAYGIPNSYVEALKVNYGSAVHDLTTDDKITFPHIRKGSAKSILRRNLARIIEERLCDICDFVRHEIKEAGCGPRFSPIVLLTGGGAEMKNIEKLFIRELGYDDVRSVLPEYGFAEDLSTFVTHRSYATICSLLLCGAKLGSCAVAVRPTSGNDNQPLPRVSGNDTGNTTPQPPVSPSPKPQQPRPQQPQTPVPPTPKPQTQAPSTPNSQPKGDEEQKGETTPAKGEPVVAPKPITPVVPKPNNGAETIKVEGDDKGDDGGDTGPRWKFWKTKKKKNEEEEKVDELKKKLRELVFGVGKDDDI